jgi:hypothetical protein
MDWAICAPTSMSSRYRSVGRHVDLTFDCTVDECLRTDESW